MPTDANDPAIPPAAGAWSDQTAYAIVNDIPASWPRYEELAAGLGDDLPEGLIVHVAGPTDEGVRIIDVWESEAAFQTFYQERLAPLIDRLDAAHEPVFRDLHARHVLDTANPRASNPDPDENRPRRRNHC